MESTRAKAVFCGTQKEIARQIALWKHHTDDGNTVRLVYGYLSVQRDVRKLQARSAVFRVPGTAIMVDVTPRKMACWLV